MTFVVADFERLWRDITVYPLRIESTPMTSVHLFRFGPGFALFFPFFCRVLVTLQAILSVNFPAASRHVIYLPLLQALMSAFLTEFIPHLFPAVVVGSHPAVTSAHKVSLISPVFVIIKDGRGLIRIVQKGFSACVCSCMQAEAQEKEISSSISW